jgi:ADP-heptose:LPS heptosyltransferase
VEKFLALAVSAGADPAGARYRLPEAPEAAARVDAWLRRERVARFAVLHPGSSARGREKRWPPDRFGTLAHLLAVRRGLASLVSFGPDERPLAEGVVAAGGGAARLAPPTAGVLELAALLARAALFVGGDTGPLHLASAVGTPSVALFGPKDPRVYAPWQARSRVVHRPGAMLGIGVDEALSAALELLDAEAAAAARA